MARRAALPLLLALAGCGYTVANGRALKGDVRRVYARPFANFSSDPSLGVELTAALRRELQRRGADASEGAPGVIDGEVRTVASGPALPAGEGLAVTLLVKARLAVDGKPVAEKTLRLGADYLAGADALESEARRAQALQRLAADAARDVIAAFEE